jgi:NhaA family Na+:H+ antiporter
MATDIAFALGIVAMLGSRVPDSLKVLLAAIAIVDDLGAILVIAVFYTSNIDPVYLGLALAFLLSCFAINLFGVTRLSVYMLLGLPLWYCMLKSGVHATISGVLLAATIPLTLPRKSGDKLSLIRDIFSKNASPLDSPAVFLEKSLVPWVSYVIVPIFALCNSGVSLQSLQFGTVAFGVILGLVVGKPIGIAGASLIAQKIGAAVLPKGVTNAQLLGLGCLAGIGFTMSLFISSLAFTDTAINNEAKFAILIASLIAGTAGTTILTKYKAPR